MSVPVSQRTNNENEFLASVSVAYTQTMRLMRKIPSRSRHGKEIRSEMLSLANTMRNSAYKANAIYIDTAEEAKMRLNLLNTAYGTIDVLIIHAQDWIDEPFHIERKGGYRAVIFDKKYLQNYIGTLLKTKGAFPKYIKYAREMYIKKMAEFEKIMQNPDSIITKYDEQDKKEREERAVEAVRTAHYSPQDEKIVNRMKNQPKVDENGEATTNYMPNPKSLKKAAFSVKSKTLFDSNTYFPDNIAPKLN